MASGGSHVVAVKLFLRDYPQKVVIQYLLTRSWNGKVKAHTVYRRRFEGSAMIADSAFLSEIMTGTASYSPETIVRTLLLGLDVAPGGTSGGRDMTMEKAIEVYREWEWEE